MRLSTCSQSSCGRPGYGRGIASDLFCEKRGSDPLAALAAPVEVAALAGLRTGLNFLLVASCRCGSARSPRTAAWLPVSCSLCSACWRMMISPCSHWACSAYWRMKISPYAPL